MTFTRKTMKRLLLLTLLLLGAGRVLAQGEYYDQRRSLFEVLPIRSSDIVFLGNSITDGGEWAELFDLSLIHISEPTRH